MAGLDIGLTQIVGNSLGGWVALKFAARYPQRVSRMGLLVPVGIVPFKFWSFLPKMLLSNSQGRRGTERFIQSMAAKPIDRATRDFLVETARRQKWSNGVIPSVVSDAELRQLTMPLLLVVGVSDIFCDPNAMIARFRRVAPHVRAEQLADCSHQILHDQPERVQQAIMRFLEA